MKLVKSLSILNTQGLTLLEMMVVLSLSIVLLTLAIPSSQQLWARHIAQRDINTLFSAIQFARNQAILRSVSVILCPSVNQTTCSDEWNHASYLAFIESNPTTSKAQTILAIFPAIHQDAHLEYNRNQQIRFLSNGYTAGFNGSFYYCPAKGDITHARTLVINKAGRPRISRGQMDVCQDNQ